ncbi:hypothetical protein, partial [Pseudoalteromonas phenolica]
MSAAFKATHLLLRKITLLCKVYFARFGLTLNASLAARTVNEKVKSSAELHPCSYAHRVFIPSPPHAAKLRMISGFLPFILWTCFAVQK